MDERAGRVHAVSRCREPRTSSREDGWEPGRAHRSEPSFLAGGGGRRVRPPAGSQTSFEPFFPVDSRIRTERNPAVDGEPGHHLAGGTALATGHFRRGSPCLRAGGVRQSHECRGLSGICLGDPEWCQHGPVYAALPGAHGVPNIGGRLGHFAAIPGISNRHHWADRIYYIGEDGRAKPLSLLWGSQIPWPLQSAAGLLELLASKRLRPAIRLLLAERGQSAL